MASGLTQQQIDFFRANGYLFPLHAISLAEAAALRGRIEAYEAQAGEEVNKRLKIKAHLAFPWMCELARHPAIVQAVQSLIGPDVLLFGSSAFAKNARDIRFVSWHQDSAYYGLDPHDCRYGMGGVVAGDVGERLPASLCLEVTRARIWSMKKPTMPTICWRAASRCAELTIASRSKCRLSPGSSHCTTNAPRMTCFQTARTTDASVWRSSTWPPTSARRSARVQRCRSPASTPMDIGAGIPSLRRTSIPSRWSTWIRSGRDTAIKRPRSRRRVRLRASPPSE